MTHDEAFLQAMIETPDDDTPRLVYADWLDEHGDPDRAEFIRIQCELAARTGPGTVLRRHLDSLKKTSRNAETAFLRNLCAVLEPGDQGPRVRALEERAAALLDAHGESWRQGLPFPVHFRRGFVEVLEVGVSDYLRHHATLETLAPAQAVHLTSFAPDGADEVGWEEEEAARQELTDQLAACPLLRRWTDLETLACPGPLVFEMLLESPHLTSLRRLVVCNNEVGPGVNLVANARFSGLTWLDLGGSNSAWGRPGDDDFVDIVTSRHLARLEYLGFDSNNVTDEGIVALADSPTMSRLRSLCLAANPVSWNGLRLLAESPHLTSLEHLDLSYGLEIDRLDDRAIAALIESPLLGRLTLLDLSHNPIGDEAISRLAAAPGASRLRVLALGDEQRFLSARGVRALADSPYLFELRRLVLPAVRLDDGAASALAHSRRLANLSELVVHDGPDLTDKGRQALRHRFGEGLVFEGR
jgi:uncharacterized protein (TIGR02996 family)